MKRLFILVIILLCLIPMFTKAQEELSENEILMSILNSLGGEFLEGDISINGLILDKFIENEKDLEDMGDHIIKSIGMKGEEVDLTVDIIDKEYYIKEKIIDEGYMQINYFGFDDDKNPLTIILSSYQKEGSYEGQTYLYINLIKREHFLGNNDIIYRVEDIFREFNQPMDITTCVLGKFNGDFDEKLAEDRLMEIIHRLDGKIVDEYKDYSLLTYTAYTDLIEKNIITGDDKINLNVALRYNEYDDETLIWIGTPLIASGY